MRRTSRIVLWVAGVLAAVIVALVVVVATFDWNRLKPTVDRKVSQAIGRPFEIGGDVTVDWRWEPGQGWLHALLPWPEFTVRQVRIGNPDWARRPQFARLDAARFEISPWALLHKTVRIPELHLVQPSLDLERAAADRANWHFDTGTSSGGSGWSFDLERIAFAQGKIHLRDEPTRIVLDIDLRPLEGPIPFERVRTEQIRRARRELADRFEHPVSPASSASAPARAASGETRDANGSAAGKPEPTSHFRFAWDIRGTYRGAPVKGHGRSGGVLALRAVERPFPIQADVRMGHNRLAFVGTLSDPLHLAALDVRLWLAGDSMGDLYPSTGVNLPTTPPYSTEGHLVASLRKGRGGRYSYRQFRGRVGGSDLDGTLTFEAGGAQPSLNGHVHSGQLRATDLGSIVGSGPGAAAEAGHGSTPPPGQVLPVARFHTDRWKAMDADVMLDGDRITLSPLPPITSLHTHITLANGMLQLSPLRMDLAGGTMAGTITLDGSREPMPGALTLDIRHLLLKELFPKVQAMQGSLGQINGGIDLHMHGNSVASLLGSADGELKLLMNDGAVSKLVLEEAGLNLGHVAMEKLFGSENVQINCAAADFPANQGVFDARLLVMDTPDATIRGEGRIDLGSEKLDLTIRPHTKGARFLTLRTPITVGGTLKNPDIGVKPGPLIARAAGAVALGAVAAPAAALLALIAPGDDDQGQNTCRQVLQRLHGSAGKGSEGDGGKPH